MSIVRRVAVAVLVVALLGAAGGIAVAWSQGYRLFAVTSGSMAPTLDPGDLVLVVPAGDYRPGDIITFGHGAGITTHRVHGIDDSGLVTQGDANPSPDAFSVGVQDVAGEVVRMVPNGGYALVFFQRPTGAPAVMAGLLLMVLLWGLFFPPDDERTPDGDPARESERAARLPAGDRHPVRSLATDLWTESARPIAGLPPRHVRAT